MHDPSAATIATISQNIWGDTAPDMIDVIAVLGVVYGDLHRHLRTERAGGPVDWPEVHIELMNMAMASLRLLVNSGGDIPHVLSAAMVRQMTAATLAGRRVDPQG